MTFTMWRVSCLVAIEDKALGRVWATTTVFVTRTAAMLYADTVDKRRKPLVVPAK